MFSFQRCLGLFFGAVLLSHSYPAAAQDEVASADLDDVVVATLAEVVSLYDHPGVDAAMRSFSGARVRPAPDAELSPFATDTEEAAARRLGIPLDKTHVCSEGVPVGHAFYSVTIESLSEREALVWASILQRGGPDHHFGTDRQLRLERTNSSWEVVESVTHFTAHGPCSGSE